MRGLEEGIGSVAQSGPLESVGAHTLDGKCFLGARIGRNGSLEIVYDKLDVRRCVWRVTSGSVGLVGLQQACERAINADDCMATIYQALANGGIRIECTEERFPSDIK